MLELIDTAMRSDCFVNHRAVEPTRFTLTVHWNLSLIWQIIYRLSANQLTAESLLRFLRSNHDLLAKHMQLNLISGFPEAQANLKPDTQTVAVTDQLSRRTCKFPKKNAPCSSLDKFVIHFNYSVTKV